MRRAMSTGWRSITVRSVCIAGVVMACLMSGPVTRSDDNDDPYESKVMRQLVELPLGVPYESTWGEKRIYRAGDSIALGIVHGFTAKELLDPGRLKRALSLMRVSFSQPDFIVHEPDRDPVVTLLLLSFLQRQGLDPSSKKAVTELRTYVCAQTYQRRGMPGNMCIE